jgi:hypothetical protein
MKVWQAPTSTELVKAEGRLRNPRPGGRIEAGQRLGVDLTLLIHQLRLSPEERVREMLLAAEDVEELRCASRRGRL